MTMRWTALVAALLALGCGGMQTRPASERELDPDRASCGPSSALEEERLAMPDWTQFDTVATRRSTVLSGPPKETVHIESTPEPDPVDAILRRSRRRVRSLSLHQAPVDDTLRMFASMGHFNVVIPGEVASRRVSIELHDVTLAGAFRAVLASARLEARVVADNILEVRAMPQLSR